MSPRRCRYCVKPGKQLSLEGASDPALSPQCWGLRASGWGLQWSCGFTRGCAFLLPTFLCSSVSPGRKNGVKTCLLLGKEASGKVVSCGLL